ncbi:MAG: ATP-grasp domain-containing protein [Bacteroidales bacterium]|nr:ATP-grasp domain-containing protein [Bacteroidales bacterium]
MNILLASISGYFDSLAEIPYMFKKAGCTVDIFCGEESWLRSNKFHDHWIEIEGTHDQFAAKLFEVVEQNPDKYAWILLLDDATVKVMNDRITSEDLFKKFMPLTKMENRELLSSKLGLSVLCEKYNILTPKFLNFSTIINKKTIVEKLQFPILLKEDFSCGGVGIQKCDDETLLDECIGRVVVRENLVVQEYIDGEDVGLEALFHDGKLVMYNAAEILTYMYNRFSFTTRRNYYQNERIEAILRKMGESFGLNGFASIQFIYHPVRDQYYLVEVDCRTNLWMPYSRFTPQNFTDGIKFILYGTPIKPSKKPIGHKTEVLIFDRDIRRCVKHRDYIGLLKWIVNWKGYWKYIPFYDLKLFKRIFMKQVNDFRHKLT